MIPTKKPTKQDLEEAKNKRVPDIIASGLTVLFCGINPGLYTAAIGHHYGRPGNRFWTTLYKAGITDRLLSPYEEEEMLKKGYGLTNVVPRPTAGAAEISDEEFKEGGRVLEEKVMKYKPKWVAFVGIGAYRTAFHRPKAVMGPQEETIGDTKLWVLPNPSGLNANYSSEDFARLFREMHETAFKKGK